MHLDGDYYKELSFVVSNDRTPENNNKHTQPKS